MILINITFVEQGWRSSIQSSLCSQCPLDSEAGCCKIKTTLFWGDLGYIGVNYPDLLPGLLRKSTARVGNQGISYECRSDKCSFLTTTGCGLPMDAKSLICRTFTCQGLGLDSHPQGIKWLAVLERLSREERQLNSKLADQTTTLGLTKPVDLIDYNEEFIALYKRIYAVEPLWLREIVMEKEIQLFIKKPELLAWRLC